MMPTISITNHNLTMTKMRDQCCHLMTIAAHSKILGYAQWSTICCAQQAKCNGQLLTVRTQLICCIDIISTFSIAVIAPGSSAIAVEARTTLG